MVSGFRPFAAPTTWRLEPPSGRGRVPHVMAGVGGRDELRGPPGGFRGCRLGAIAGSLSGFRPPLSGTGRSPLYLIDAADVARPVEHPSAAAGRPSAPRSKGLLSSGGSGSALR